MIKRYRSAKNKKYGLLGLCVLVIIGLIAVYYYFHYTSVKAPSASPPLEAPGPH
jgi:hypothetical protein